MDGARKGQAVGGAATVNGAARNGHGGGEAPSPNGGNGRDAHGRFAKGYAGGPGNPFARQVAALRRALLAQVTEGDVAEVARKLLERAKSGDLTAVKLLFAYAIGRPGEAVDPDTLDVHELRCYREGARLADTGTAALKSIQPDYLCELLRIALPCVRHDQAAMIAEQLQETVGGRET